MNISSKSPTNFKALLNQLVKVQRRDTALLQRASDTGVALDKIRQRAKLIKELKLKVN